MARSISAREAVVRRGCVRRLGTVILALIVLGALAWLGRAPLLRGAADLWIVSDKPTHADAVVVLGGGLENRPFVAADVFKKGLVDKVLVSQVVESRAVKMGIIEGHTQANRQALLKLGVPASAIETFGTANRSTEDEAVTLREWADTHKAAALIIPIEIFSSRRVRWIFRREFAGKSTRIEVLAFDMSEFTRDNWWQHDKGIINFQNEILKYIFYRIHY
jgi:uncharacterized SAM-binding protein YcdF (DUF218 family)